MVKLLEKRLAEYLRVKNIVLVSNGTIALEIAYRTLGIEKDVITTPFSYVATTSSIVWEGCAPVFVDIHPEYLTGVHLMIKIIIIITFLTQGIQIT